MKKEEKRERPNWDEYFMHEAFWNSKRSSCIYLQTGAVVVRDKRIIAQGYNGAPRNIRNCLEVGCRKDKYNIEFDEKGKGVCRGLHAEYNAMSQISSWDLPGTKLYSLYLPCSNCAKQIVGNGIIEVVYAKVYHEEDLLTKELFEEAGVKLRKMDIDLEKYFEMLRHT